MLKTHFDKLSHAIKHGKTREIGEIFKEIRRARMASARTGFATIKLAAVYDSAEDCLEMFNTVDICHTEECLAIVAKALLAPDGETVLAATAECLDLSKSNKRVHGCLTVRHLAGRYEGRSVTVGICALSVDAGGCVALLDAEAQVAISGHGAKS
jgi:hypothetical protein